MANPELKQFGDYDFSVRADCGAVVTPLTDAVSRIPLVQVSCKAECGNPTQGKGKSMVFGVPLDAKEKATSEGAIKGFLGPQCAFFSSEELTQHNKKPTSAQNQG